MQVHKHWTSQQITTRGPPLTMPVFCLNRPKLLLNSGPNRIPSEKENHLTGIYDLVVVLTHKGRSADSGHYVAWVKQESGQKWIEFDDDNPIRQREEDIVKLSGGESHLGYEFIEVCSWKGLDIILGNADSQSGVTLYLKLSIEV
ncbi:hypothetical protein F3Y22_tig00110450pilonHSYRG00616 [Hibiscus syriacus]|uniref:ubiquitinyl hydrolase 1 n=1 Tax=Hibiscus syriacus TaxID=106335 RepID=A0A6A3AIY7_HIBSY|nr:hypothetical protein F3Y22_tig00110450pilonHSYRG00616 [Hibiscus syriacus]